MVLLLLTLALAGCSAGGSTGAASGSAEESPESRIQKLAEPAILGTFQMNVAKDTEYTDEQVDISDVTPDTEGHYTVSGTVTAVPANGTSSVYSFDAPCTFEPGPRRARDKIELGKFEFVLLSDDDSAASR
jgi:hypothetical protein